MRLDDLVHWLSSGSASFARDLDDGPEIAGLGLAVALDSELGSLGLFVLVGMGMGLGCLVSGWCVTETMAEEITAMTLTEGLSTDLITGVLVTVPSRWGIPVSTTHVSSSAIIGLGLRRLDDPVQWRTVSLIVQAWIVTLPASAGLAGGAFWLIQRVMQ